MRLLAIPALVAGCAAARSDGHVREATAEAWRDHFAAVKRKDAAGVGRLYTDDVIYVAPGEAEVRGRRAIDEMEARGLATAEILDVTQVTHALRVHGDLAYELGTVEGPVQPHGQAARVVTFRYMARWKREADEYRGWHLFEGRRRIQHLVGEPER